MGDVRRVRAVVPVIYASGDPFEVRLPAVMTLPPAMATSGFV